MKVEAGFLTAVLRVGTCVGGFGECVFCGTEAAALCSLGCRADGLFICFLWRKLSEDARLTTDQQLIRNNYLWEIQFVLPAEDAR